ncbi:MAG: PspC domain-containing protein [Candidatus Limnocylindrales bacterium]|nr:PspC domain-containing protein [Candidatus Limnocylindrales bacterium]
MNRRLYRCRHDRKLAGVASGIAEYFDIDPTIVRVLWVLSVFFGGLGLFAYIVMAIIMPLEPEEGLAVSAPAGDPSGEAPVPSPTGWHSTPATHRHASRDNGRLVTFLGIALILFGAIALVDAFLPAWADGGRFIWPAFILGIGALLVASAVRREPTPP